jgi:hypothetical protein
MTGRLTTIHHHPLLDRVVRLVQAVVRPAVDRDNSLAAWRFGRVNLTRRFKGTRDFNAEVAQHTRARLVRMVVNENIMAARPQTWLPADEGPDLAHRRPPSRSNLSWRDRAPDHGQLAGGNNLHIDGHRHDWSLDRWELPAAAPRIDTGPQVRVASGHPRTIRPGK